MSVIRIGELSLSSAIPILATFQASLTASVGIGLPEIQGKLAGLANVLLAITVAPPALGATITAAITTVASLQAAISGPTVTLQVAAITALIAELNLQLGTLTVAAGLSIPSATLSAYVYDGSVGNFGVEVGSELSASLPGPPGHCNALIFATTDSAQWAAASVALRTS